jgi:hypothetical protein
MRRNRFVASGIPAVVAGVAMLAIAVSAGSASSAENGRSQTAARSGVGVRQTQLGKILVDSHGRTLYLSRATGPTSAGCRAPALQSGRRLLRRVDPEPKAG